MSRSVTHTNTPHARQLLQVVTRVRTTAIEAYKHAEVPFTQVVSALQVPPDPSRSPVYQCALTFETRHDSFGGRRGGAGDEGGIDGTGLGLLGQGMPASDGVWRLFASLKRFAIWVGCTRAVRTRTVNRLFFVTPQAGAESSSVHSLLLTALDHPWEALLAAVLTRAR